WPAADDRRQRALRARLGDVLLAGATPDQRTAALVALLAATEAAAAAVDAPDRATRKAVARRAAEVGGSAWAAESVRRVIESAQAAIAGATTAAVTAAVIAST
ncbi:MAG TPA: GPP34 family phosphoprotein, partial [Kineosporiaceae bacterium]|nr:GPP34 family phosphoprotein [Kineosporiaceae bacterium]